MTGLSSRHLTRLSLDVDLATTMMVGDGPAGRRLVAPVAGGMFEGEGLSGTVLPGGADWVTQRDDGHSTIDVRLTLRTDDGAMLGLTYQGRFIGGTGLLQRFVAGEALDAGDFSLQTVARFETADARYIWLNDAIVIGLGEQGDTGPAYQMYEIMR